MTPKLRHLLLHAGVVLAVGCAATLPEAKVHAPVSICTLVAHGPSADRTTVLLSAEFVTDGLEHSYLADKDCPDVSVAAYWSDTKRDARSVKRLDQAVWGADEGASRRFRYRAYGEFRWHDDKMSRGSFYSERIVLLERIGE